jgi:UDP-N-acetylglucosamine diphosphorylase/glucosamine-1-phosphate N-acetyltransferase
MQYALYEDGHRPHLLPLAYTRPVWDLRIGIDTLAQKWERHLGQPTARTCAPSLAALFATPLPAAECVFVNGGIVPTPELVRAICTHLPPGGYLHTPQGTVLAFRCAAAHVQPTELGLEPTTLPGVAAGVLFEPPVLHIRRPWDLFRLNGEVLRRDFAELTRGRQSQPVADKFTAVYAPENVFIEPGARVRAAVLNAESGPIYIGPGADVQEGAMVHGAHAICEGAVLNMGAKLRGDSTIGPYCKVGGEVSNSVLWGYSNKAHDGFLGNSVLGQWCNLGADTNTSNLKNNYGTVRVHSHATGHEEDTGLLFHGLLMADHAKAGINTMFNTGTVVGVCANVYGGGFPAKFIPSFAWGGAMDGWQEFRLEKAYEVAERVMARRGLPLTPQQRELLAHVHRATQAQRAGW